jgi:tetratricopeptide (TPR) repeat protein
MRESARLAKLVLAGALAVLSCSGVGGGAPTLSDVQNEIDGGHLEAAVDKAEAARDKNPDSVPIRIMLAEANYKLAREALEAGREGDYTHRLGRAQAELLAAAAIDPKSADVHLWLGFILAYQGDIDATFTSFKNAYRLEPNNSVHMLNFAEVSIYAGKLSSARRLLDKAKKRGGSRATIEINEMLAAWRQGDYVEARDLFDGVYAMNPDVVRTWNEAPVTDPIESFEDFTEFCCSHIACGPYMDKACKQMDLEVVRKSVMEETLRREVELAAERRRRLKEIYDEHRELKIEIED